MGFPAFVQPGKQIVLTILDAPDSLIDKPWFRLNTPLDVGILDVIGKGTLVWAVELTYGWLYYLDAREYGDTWTAYEVV